MSKVESFEAAVEAVKTLPTAPSRDQLLMLYALYKQATVGDVSGARPGLFDPKGRAKYDAWAGHKGTAANDAKIQYVELVCKLAMG